MKKNKMMRLASCLLVAVLLTTSMISGTFAKYTTSETGTDSARVAKFGVEITANGTTFAKKYNDKADAEGTQVVSNVNVVAPGTEGEMASMQLTGTPEVAVKVSYNGEFALEDNMWKVGDDFYCPLVITVRKNATEVTKIDGAEYTVETEFETAVNDAIVAYSATYEPGTDLSGKNSDALTVSWEWPFYESDARDAKDTELGDVGAADVQLKVTTTVTQID